MIDADLYEKNTNLNAGLTRTELNTQAIADFDVEKEYYARINAILQIPINRANEFAGWFVNEAKLRRHFNTINFFFKTVAELDAEIQNMDDFKYNIIMSNRNQIQYLRKLLTAFGCTIDANTTEITLPNRPNAEIAKQLADQYKLIFRYRGNRIINFENKQNVLAFVAIMMKQLFGDDIIKIKQLRKNKVRIQKYTINQTVLNNEQKLYDYRNPIGYDD